MYILEVIPIARGVGKETLSYFSLTAAPLGALISVPIRNRQIEALVVGLSDAREKKSELRSLDYPVRKAGTLHPSAFLSEYFVRAAREAADYYVATTGAILHAFLPNAVYNIGARRPLPLSDDLTRNAKPNRSRDEVNVRPAFEAQLLLADTDDRLYHYKQLIRQTLAQGASTIILTPTIGGSEILGEALSRGIEEYTVLIHGSLTKRAIVERWQKIATTEHPLVIIGTATALSAPRTDVRLVVVEEEGSPAYKMRARPFADTRTVAELYARQTKSSFILAGAPIRPETMARREEGVADLAPPKLRIPPRVPGLSTKLVDMRVYRGATDKTSLIIGDELQTALQAAAEAGERAFLFVGRRGFAPTTVCGDCDTVVVCDQCSAPVVLHKTPQGPRFICHKCGRERPPDNRCAVCDGWKLVTLGIGIELVEETLASLFPRAPLFRIDSDATPTRKRAEAVAKTFWETRSAILLGTEMALSFLTSLAASGPASTKEGLAHAAVVSFDALLAMPDFRINERIVDIVLTLRSLTERTLLIQTRSAERTTIEQALAGDLAGFYRDELRERRAFGYPPFKTLVKITLEGKEANVRAEMEQLVASLNGYEVHSFPAFTPIVAGKFSMHALIKLPPGVWPEPLLLAKLRSLPPNYTINVDPGSVL